MTVDLSRAAAPPAVTAALDAFGADSALAVLTAHSRVLLAGDADRPFRLASVTKPMTALAALTAVDAGEVELDDVVVEPDVRLEDLLAQCSGLFYDSTGVIAPPRSRRHYSNYGFDLPTPCSS